MLNQLEWIVNEVSSWQLCPSFVLTFYRRFKYSFVRRDPSEVQTPVKIKFCFIFLPPRDWATKTCLSKHSHDAVIFFLHPVNLDKDDLRVLVNRNISYTVAVLPMRILSKGVISPSSGHQMPFTTLSHQLCVPRAGVPSLGCFPSLNSVACWKEIKQKIERKNVLIQTVTWAAEFVGHQLDWL